MIPQLAKNVFALRTTDPTRETFQFVHLPAGTSYNAYLVQGSKKTALIDTVDERKTDVLLAMLKETGVKQIDYVIANHAEKDHTASLPAILKLFPNAKVVCNEMCKKLIISELNLKEDVLQIIKDKETLDLGGKTLQFIFMPWVHWPETMVTYLQEDKILFPCDFLAAHIAEEPLYSQDDAAVREAAKRYFAEVLMPFRMHIRNHLKVLRGMNITMIAPSHGQVYKNPEFIFKLYDDWNSEEGHNKATIVYATMTGNTQVMVEHLSAALAKRGITVEAFDITYTDIGDALTSTVDAQTLIIASPVFLFGPHPSMVYAAHIFNSFVIKAKHVAIIGSDGWGGTMPEQLKAMMPNLKADYMNTVLVRGFPGEEGKHKLDELADTIQRFHNTTPKLTGYNVKILEVVSQARDVRSLKLEKPAQFTFKPGQFIMATVHNEQGIASRAYSICSGPFEPNLMLTFRLAPDGQLTPHLYSLKAGDSLDIKGPYGAFLLDEARLDNVVLIAGGVGITPMRSYISYLAEKKISSSVKLIYGAKDAEHILFRDEFEALQAKNPNFHAYYTVEEDPKNEWKWHRGFISLDFIKECVGDVTKPVYYLCGPPIMVQAIAETLEKAGVPHANIKMEKW